MQNFNRTAIFWHFMKQAGIIACPTYWRLRRFPAIQKNIYKDKMNLLPSTISRKFAYADDLALLHSFGNLK